VYLTNDTQDNGTGPDVNRGTTTGLLMRVNGSSRAKAPYIRFDLTGITDRTSASLSFDFTSNTGNRVRSISVYGLNDGNAGENWGETSVTYATAAGVLYTDPDPATAGNQPSNTIAIDPATTTLLGTFSTPAGLGAATFSSAALDAFLAADTNNSVTFILVAPTDANADFTIASKEATGTGIFAPTLTVGAAVPEPASLGILALGGVALLARRRK
jgi:hypothetical protein